MAELRRALALAQDEVGDEPGVVTGAFTTLRPRDPVEEAAEQAERERVWRDPDPDDRATRAGVAGTAVHEPQAGPDYAWPPRALAALGAAALTVWLTLTALAPSPVPPAAAGLLAGAAVLLLPRLGWGALTIALAVLAASQHLPRRRRGDHARDAAPPRPQPGGGHHVAPQRRRARPRPHRAGGRLARGGGTRHHAVAPGHPGRDRVDLAAFGIGRCREGSLSAAGARCGAPACLDELAV